MRKILLLAFLSNIIFASVFAQQIRSFTSDSAVYLQELDKFTDNYISSEESKTLDAFKLLWSSPTLSPEDRNEIVVFSNFLLKKNGRPSPHFIKYFSSLLLFYSGNYEKMNFNDWRKSLRFYLENKSSSLKVTEQFLDLTLTLLESNTLYNNSATIWRVPQSNFTFEFGKESPLIRFSNVDLICNSKRDSIFIANTSGVLNPEDLSWTGKKGLVTWERAGYNATDVYAELSNYSLSLRKTEYKADSVQFYYKKYFNSPLLGKIEEKVMLINKPENALYPKFYSYQNKYILPGLFKGIEFTGGLSMQGAKLNGTGNEYEPAELDIYYRDTLKMRIQTTQLLITGTGMRSGSVSMSLYLENDSIFHPDLQFNFIENGDEFRFNKSQDYTSEGPYKNSYHKMDMNFEEFLWKRNSGVILFKPNTGTAIGQATFESNGFFNAEFFDKIQGMDNIHPLVGLWQYGRGIGLNKFPASNYANYLGIDNYQVRQQLMKLSRLGFIFFDDASDMVILNDKINYFLDASIGKTDYDVIYFTSRTNAPLENASLNLENNDLTINGIERIFLSDSQNVVLIPDKNQIIMKRNRNFQFNGSIRAGLFTYYGSNFFFDYEGFKINLQNIDSLSLRVKTGEKDNYGQNIVKGISNLIEQVTGEIQIDDPSNKSGLRDFPQYPIFTSRENAFVYFNEPTIQKGVYGKKDMYFEVYPFTIDSLDNFSREGMLLPGKFVSGGILPPLEQTLSLRDDYSLGFFYKAPKEGIPIYEAKGTFYNDMEMSNRGLHGSGQLDYLTSTTYSDDFLFHPDSVMTVSREFLVRKQIAPVEFPKVNSSNNKITWYTKKDQFYASKTDKDFTLFSDTVRLGGDLLLQPSGLSGKGRMDLVDATIASAQFKYKSEKILSDSSDFRLRGPGLEKPAMNMDNVNLAVDFTSRTAQIKSNEDYTLVEFQENRYISMLDFFNWDMKTKEIEMGLSKNLNSKIFADSLSGARYISLNPAQDSLSFVSGKSVFDYKNVIIKALDVPYIQIADARIYPSEGRLNVEKNAKIQRLLKADIIADYTNKYYPLYDSKVDILARNDYKASASYDYIDENQKKWKISFNEVKVDTSIQTIGLADISVIDSFKLSPYFEFQGEVRLSARRPNLMFDGATRLVHQCQPGRNWLKFETEIDPDSILIPVPDEPIDINLKKIYAGTMITRDSTHIYSTFFSGRKDYFDEYLTHASGFLRYDKYNEQYEIAKMDKLENKALPGDYLSLDTDSCFEYGEGKINFHVDYGQVKVFATGNAKHDMGENTYKTDVLLGVDFFFSDVALGVFAGELDSLANLKAYDLTSPFYKKALRDYIGLDNAELMENELGLYGNIKTIPDAFNKKLLISDVRLEWNQNTRSYRYHGPVGIIRVGNTSVNKVVEAYIELSKRGSGDLLDIYFVLDPKTYYYFGYNPGSLQVTSSNTNFNSIILNLKDSDRKMKVKTKGSGYIYALAPDRRVQLFLRRYLEGEGEDEGQDGQP